MTTDVEKAWLAGFFDGECCIVLNEQRSPGRMGRDQLPAIRTIVQVANCNRPNIDTAKAIISDIVGREVRYTFKPAKNRRQAAYVLSIARHSEIEKLLTTLHPLLAGKRLQAELMLEYLSIAPGSSHKYDERHYGMVQQMHRLNARAGSPHFVEGNTEGSPTVFGGTP